MIGTQSAEITGIEFGLYYWLILSVSDWYRNDGDGVWVVLLVHPASNWVSDCYREHRNDGDGLNWG